MTGSFYGIGVIKDSNVIMSDFNPILQAKYSCNHVSYDMCVDMEHFGLRDKNHACDERKVVRCDRRRKHKNEKTFRNDLYLISPKTITESARNIITTIIL